MGDGVGAVGVSSPQPADTIAATRTNASPGGNDRGDKTSIISTPAAAPEAQEAQRTANSWHPGVTSSRPGAGKCRLAGATTPAARNCTVRIFSPSGSKT